MESRRGTLQLGKEIQDPNAPKQRLVDLVYIYFKAFKSLILHNESLRTASAYCLAFPGQPLGVDLVHCIEEEYLQSFAL
jgi:hypothetical protein